MSYTIVNLSRVAYYYQPKSTDNTMIISYVGNFLSVFIEPENWDIREIINGFIRFIVS